MRPYLRHPQILVARGTTIDIQVRDLTPKATPTDIPFLMNFSMNGTGKNIFPASQKI